MRSENLSEVSAAVERTKPQARSRLSNGRLLANVDGRSTWARLMRDTLADLVAHCGGADVVSETRRLAARRVAVIEAELCFLEDKFAQVRAAGGEPDAAAIDLYARVANQQRRLSEALGWERHQRVVSSSLGVMLEQAANAPVDRMSERPNGNAEAMP